MCVRVFVRVIVCDLTELSEVVFLFLLSLKMSSGTNVVQVTNVSPSATSEQMRTLFGFLGTVEELKLFPPE